METPTAPKPWKTFPEAKVPGYTCRPLPCDHDEASLQAANKPPLEGDKQEEAAKPTSASPPDYGFWSPAATEHDASNERPNKRQKRQEGRDGTATADVGKEEESLPAVPLSKFEQQDKDLSELKDKLREHVSVEELEEMISFNHLGDDTDTDTDTGTEDELRERCADGMVFGAILPCPRCNDYMEFHGESYRCRGLLSGRTTCTFTTKTIARVQEKWHIGDAHNNYSLMDWYCTKTRKRGARLLVPDSPPIPRESFLEGCYFVTIGRLSLTQAKLKEKVEAAGGFCRRMLSSILPYYTMQWWREALIVVTTEKMLGDEKFCEGIKSCREFYKSSEVHMVKDQYVLDCLEKRQKLSMDGYKLELPQLTQGCRNVQI